MKIWILNHYATPPELGLWSRHYKFAEELILRGYHVEIFAANTIHNTTTIVDTEGEEYVAKKFGRVPFVFVRTSPYYGNGIKRIRNMLQYGKRVIKVGRKFSDNKPDVIYASSAHPLTWVSGYLLSKKYKAKFIAETRDLWPETLVAMGQIQRNSVPAKILYSLEKFIYKKADRLIFTFPGGKDYVAGIGLDNSKARYINNGIDLEIFEFNKDNYIYEDTDLVGPDKFKVIYTGSMGQANELSYLVQAAKLLKEQNCSDIQFILFGDGYQRQELEKYVKDNDLENVCFKGIVDKKYIPNILTKSDLNIFTGKHIDLYRYGLSLNKMFDYFASGKPTLSNIECGYDMLEEYGCGLTVEGGSPEAIAEGILRFYDMSEEDYNNYCKNALNAAKDFDFKVLTDKLEQILLELED